MATYVVMFSLTEQGMQNVKDSPSRVDAARQTFRAYGAEVKEFYAVMGASFDTLFLVEAPNDEAVGKAVLAVASLGSVRTRTHRAFTEAEYRKMIAGLR